MVSQGEKTEQLQESYGGDRTLAITLREVVDAETMDTWTEESNSGEYSSIVYIKLKHKINIIRYSLGIVFKCSIATTLMNMEGECKTKYKKGYTYE